MFKFKPDRKDTACDQHNILTKIILTLEKTTKASDNILKQKLSTFQFRKTDSRQNVPFKAAKRFKIELLRECLNIMNE